MYLFIYLFIYLFNLVYPSNLPLLFEMFQGPVIIISRNCLTGKTRNVFTLVKQVFLNYLIASVSKGST